MQPNQSPCYPEDARRDVCLTCARHRIGKPAPAVDLPKLRKGGEWATAVRTGRFRVSEVIDATAATWPDGRCPMYEQREIPRPHTEPENA